MLAFFLFESKSAKISQIQTSLIWSKNSHFFDPFMLKHPNPIL